MFVFGFGVSGRTVAEDFLAGFRRGLMEAGKRVLDVEDRCSYKCGLHFQLVLAGSLFLFFLAFFVNN